MSFYAEAPPAEVELVRWAERVEPTTMEDLIRSTEVMHGLPRGAIVGDSQEWLIQDARREVVVFCKSRWGWGDSRIARALNRTHGTVVSMRKTHAARAAREEHAE